MKYIPACFHPTTVLLLDDDSLFLDSLMSTLSHQASTFLAFDSPQLATKFLTESYKPNPFINRYLESSNSVDYQKQSIKINVRDLYKEAFNPDRFKQISTLIVDYNMPGMNGLEFLGNFRDEGFQKILLTGKADEHVAVEAFNQGLINQFIQKQNKNLLEILNTAIYQSQINYFSNLSKFILNSILKNKDEPTALALPQLQTILFDVFKKYNIIESYLFEYQGSFFLISNEKKIFALFTKSKDQLEAFYLEAKDEPSVSNALKEDLKNYKKMLCYPVLGTNAFPEPSDWEEFIFPAAPLDPPTNSFYFSIATSVPNFGIENFTAFSPKTFVDKK